MNLFYETNKPSQPELDYYSEAVFFSNLNFLLGLLQNYMFFLRGTYETHIVDVFKWKKIMIEKQQKDLIEKLHAH